jgi:hypothetical protein
MKTSPRYHRVLISASLLLPLAVAQRANAAGAGHGASSAAHANAAAASSAHRPAATGASDNAVAATRAADVAIPTTKGTVKAGLANSPTPPNHRPERDTGKSAEAHAKGHGTARAPGLAPDGNPGGKISASLHSQATAAHLRNATRDNRDKVLAEVDTNLEASRRSVAALREQGRQLKKEAREQFKAAAEEVRVREKALRESLKAARKATGDQIPAAQARLAADYEGYATAVAVTESVVNAGPALKVNTGR